jgi:hypothetical protein
MKSTSPTPRATRLASLPCEGSGHRVAAPSLSGEEVKCPQCHYWAAPVRKYGEYQVRSHRAVATDEYGEEQ